MQMYAGMRIQKMAHHLMIDAAIALGPGGAHGRTLAPVQQPVLQCRAIRSPSHQAAQRIHLMDQVALADAADGGIAGHLRNGIEVLRDQPHARTPTGRGPGRLTAGMARTHDDDIHLVGVFHVKHRSPVTHGRASLEAESGQIQPKKKGGQWPPSSSFQAKPGLTSVPCDASPEDRG